MSNFTILGAIGEILVTITLPIVLCSYLHKWYDSEEVFLISVVALWMITASLIANGNLTLGYTAEILKYTQGK